MDILRSKSRCFFVWLGVSTVTSLITSLISILHWEYVYIVEPGVLWSPLDDCMVMIMSMPIGWVLAQLTPAGWLVSLSLILMLSTRSYKPLYITVCGAILFGIYWPKFSVGMMGV